MSQWMVLALMPIYLVTGCGDLEPEMQDTRTVILKMGFDHRSSSRTSSISASELSQYYTHLILVLPSEENLHNSYWMYPSKKAEGLMGRSSREITLEIPLSVVEPPLTEMRVFAFLFTGDYDSPDQLFSAELDVGLSGKSDPFYIDRNTNSLIVDGVVTNVLDITLCQNWSVEGVCQTLSAPTGLTATGGASQVVLDWTPVSGASSYTVYWGSATGVSSSSTSITSVSTDSYTHTGLDYGTTYYYKVAAVDSAGTGMLSSEVNATTFTTGGSGDYGGTYTTAPTVTFNPANGDTGEAISDNITITFSEAVRNIDNTVLTDSNIDSLITLKLDNASGNNINFDATINGDKTVITINPTSNLPNSQAVYVALGATVEDSTDNVITAVNATFTTVMGGYYIAGDGSGGGGAGDYGYEYNKLALGGHGAGDNDTIVGTSYNDVIFGDGSGGGGGGSKHRLAAGGNSGSGSDNIDGGAGNDIIFGDGFKGNDNHGTTNWEHGGIGGFGGGGGGGGSYSPNGNGGNGGLLAGGGGGQSDKVFGISLYGGVSGGINSKPAGGVAHISDNKWGGNSAMPSIVGAGYFNEQSKGGTGSNNFGAGGGAGFGGLNSINQVITTSTSPWTYQYCSGGLPQGGNGGTGSTNKVIYDDSSGNLYSYVSGQLTSIFGSTPGTLNGVGTGADIIDGGAGNDHLFGLGGNDIFVFEITDAGASDVDVIWDFNRLGEGDKIRLTNNNNIISNTDINSIIASQVANGNNRTIIFNDGGGKQVSIEVKNIGRNLVVADFDS